VSSELTALGFHLATLPVDPRVGKLIIYGSLLGCVDSALTIAAGMTARSPFMSPFDQREEADEARRTFAVEGSDHLTVLNAFSQWKHLKDSKRGNQVVNAFLKENFLGRQTLHQMEDLKKQLTKLLKDIGFLPSSVQLGKEARNVANANHGNLGLVKAVLCAGLYPNILVAPRTLIPQENTFTKPKKAQKVGEYAFQSRRKGEVYLHPSTIAFNQMGLDTRFCCYHEIVKTSKTYARDATTVSPFAMLLFGGSLKVHHAHGIVSIDGWLRFRLDAKPATLIKYLRDQMEKILLQKIVNPQDEVFDSTEGRALIESINILFGNKESFPVVRPWTSHDNPDHRFSDQQHRGGNNGMWRGSGRGRGGRSSGSGGHR
jgi:HrpA-like RNA helicase